nr:transcription factor GT-3b [Arabidopsis thaliana]
MDGHQHPHLHQLQYLNKHHLHTQSQTPEIASPVAVGDRFPQWSVEETKELIGIRGELDQTFMETKRNKLLWEVISNKMRDKSFPRSPEQCKCKWKNLVTRFKGCETMEAETARQQFPFYDDMQNIFTTRMQRMLWAESEGGGGGTSGAARKREYSSDEEEENANEELVDVSNDPKILNPKKNIAKKRKGGSNSSNSNNGVREVLEEFMRHQVRMESEWREGWEAREKERAEKEEEWRRKMEELEKERLAMERMWRDREEQRRSREEMRAEKRDSLINALLAKLTRDGSL